jgi:hypothetical protein
VWPGPVQDAFDVHNGCMVLPSIAPASIDLPMVRHAGKDMLSLALIDARNHSLHLIGQLEALVPDLSFANDPNVQGMAEALPPLWWLGYTAAQSSRCAWPRLIRVPMPALTLAKPHLQTGGGKTILRWACSRLIC